MAQNFFLFFFNKVSEHNEKVKHLLVLDHRIFNQNFYDKEKSNDNEFGDKFKCYGL